MIINKQPISLENLPNDQELLKKTSELKKCFFELNLLPAVIEEKYLFMIIRHFIYLKLYTKSRKGQKIINALAYFNSIYKAINYLVFKFTQNIHHNYPATSNTFRHYIVNNSSPQCHRFTSYKQVVCFSLGKNKKLRKQISKLLVCKYNWPKSFANYLLSIFPKEYLESSKKYYDFSFDLRNKNITYIGNIYSLIYNPELIFYSSHSSNKLNKIYIQHGGSYFMVNSILHKIEFDDSNLFLGWGLSPSNNNISPLYYIKNIKNDIMYDSENLNINKNILIYGAENTTLDLLNQIYVNTKSKSLNLFYKSHPECLIKNCHFISSSNSDIHFNFTILESIYSTYFFYLIYNNIPFLIIQDTIDFSIQKSKFYPFYTLLDKLRSAGLLVKKDQIDNYLITSLISNWDDILESSAFMESRSLIFNNPSPFSVISKYVDKKYYKEILLNNPFITAGS
tara:strand:+ start:2789 stop:4144 length:1356 start_codon:yes stop_codon:yes gene_type:complete